MREASVEAYHEMVSELRDGECGVIQSRSSGPDEVYFCGKLLGKIDSEEFDRRARRFSGSPSGIFRSLRHALRALAAAAESARFWPNVYRVNERGNADLLHPRTGRIIQSWV